MMVEKHVKPDDLKKKVIDAHSHVGVSLKAYSNVEYPYAQTIEGLYYQQVSAGVDVNVVFPFTPDLYFDPVSLTRGNCIPASHPISHVPYATENRMLMHEIFGFCPEYQRRFIPLVSVDPGREIKGQIEAILELEKSFPIYGIKIVPVICQSRVIDLLNEGRPFVDYARDRDIPFLLHTTSDPREVCSYAGDALQVIDKTPDVRFCLAHCIGFHERFLEKADDYPNAWVDTAALKIQVQLAHEDNPVLACGNERIEGDYSDHTKIMRMLMERFPETIIWGSDSPAYSFICRRKHSEDHWAEFRLKANYEDEKAALDALSEDLREKACNSNTLRFLFGC